MRIGIDGLSVTPREGGFYRAFKQVIECCDDFPAEYEIIVFLSPDTYESLSVKHANIFFRVVNVPSRIRYWAAQLYFPFAEHKYKLDVIYSPISASPILSRAKKVCMVNDLSFLRNPEELTIGARLYWRHLYTHALRKCNKIGCISRATRNDMIDLLRFNGDYIDVIYYYYDGYLQQCIHSNDSAVLGKYGIKGHYLLYVGIIAPRKNVLALIKAFHALSLKRYEFNLVICGKKGWLDESIQTYIELYSLQSRITFTGFVSNGELAVIYKNASLLILPSFMEGFGYTLIEAMSFGVPAIGSNRGSIPEVIDDALFLFDPMDVDSIVKSAEIVLDLKDSDQLLSKKIKQKVWKFSKTNTYRGLLRLLTEWKNTIEIL